MLQKLFIICIGMVYFTICLSNDVYADAREYVWTYEYMTMPEGMLEFEYYLTVKVPDADESSVNIWNHWAELEYGITERFDIAVYQQFTQTNGVSSSDFKYDGFKIRTRYRIGEKGQYILDPLLYLEYIRDARLSKPNVLEGKLILSKDIGNINIAYNQILKQEIDSDGETENEFSAGMKYELTPMLSFGFESKGNYTKDKYYLGPTASIMTRKFWITVGVVWGINDKADDIQTRIITGIPF